MRRNWAQEWEEKNDELEETFKQLAITRANEAKLKSQTTEPAKIFLEKWGQFSFFEPVKTKLKQKTAKTPAEEKVEPPTANNNENNYTIFDIEAE